MNFKYLQLEYFRKQEKNNISYLCAKKIFFFLYYLIAVHRGFTLIRLQLRAEKND